MPRPVFGKISAVTQSKINRRSSMKLIAHLALSGIRNQNFLKNTDNRQIQRTPAALKPRADIRQM